MTLEFDNVEKVYRGGKRAVSGISMKIEPGVLGLLGPNGAGKSSLMRIVATITRPTLSYLAAVKGLSARSARARIDELLELVNLSEARKRPLGKYSGGMRQRVGIDQALLNDPQLLIVDEPTVGLDPEERVRFRNMLGDLASERVVILSTHIVSDVEAVADDIAIVSAGRLLRRKKVPLIGSCYDSPHLGDVAVGRHR